MKRALVILVAAIAALCATFLYSKSRTHRHIDNHTDRIVAGLRARKYDFVTVSELLNDGGLEVARSRGLGVPVPEALPLRDRATPRPRDLC